MKTVKPVNIQIDITESGTTTLATKGKYCDKNIDINVDKVYEAGMSKAESDFWDGILDNGNRVFFEYAFYSWGAEYIRPNRKIVPTSRVLRMFQDCIHLKKVESQYFDLSISASTDSTNSNNGNGYVFQGCSELEEIEDIGMRAGYYSSTFRNCGKLHTIAVIRSTAETMYNGAFTNCTSLENITISGVIGQNGLNVSTCTKLTHDSLMSIINALEDYSEDTSGTVWKVTLGTANIKKLTDAEQEIANNKGWVIG
jgi:hypothetical protein